MVARRQSLALLTLGLLLPTLRLQPAHAQTVEVTGAVTSQLAELLEQDSYFDSQAVGPRSGYASETSTLGAPGESPTTSCESSAEADYGTLRVTVFGTASGGPDLVTMPSGNLGEGNGGALFEDYVTVLAPRPELSGTPGTAQVRVQVSGTVDADSGGALDSIAFAEWSVRVRFGPRDCENLGTGCADGTSGIARDGGSLGGGKTYEGADLPLAFETIPLPFQFDYPFLMGVQLGGIVQADADEEERTATASLELGNTLRWDGFVVVRDGSGEIVDDYGIESLTGIDWSQPVPEPDGGAPAAIAALALLVARASRLQA